MLRNHLATYLPAVLLPPAVAMGSLVLYSRVLPPGEYGRLTLIMAVTMLVIALCARWLTIGITRLYPAAERSGRGAHFIMTVLAVWAACLAVLGAGTLVFTAAFGDREPTYGWLAAIGFLIVAARTFVTCTNSVLRAQLRVGRYAITECAQALVGFALSVQAGLWFGWRAGSILAGTATGYALVAAIAAIGLVPDLAGGRPDRAGFVSLLRFAGPLTVTYGLALLLASADQFFVQALIGADAGGLYGAVNGLANRSIVLIFSGISMVVFPLSVRAMEQEGPAACRRRERQNVELVVALALPAAAFLIVAAPQMVHLLLGAAYRDAALSLLPWIVCATFVNRMAVDVFDHAFYLAQRTKLLLAVLLPAAVASVALNLLLIPHYGLLGAAIAKVGEAVVMLAFSIGIGSRLLPIGVPGRATLRIVAATSAMIAATVTAASLALPLRASSVVVLAAIAGGVYGSAALVLDVLGARRFLLTRVKRAWA
jgi:O-antigen/teichoic acid export membrane protein